MKKYFIFFVLLSLLILAAILFLKNINKEKHEKQIQENNLIKKIPTDAALIIFTKNITNLNDKINTKSQLWKLFSEIKQIKLLNSLIFSLDSILNRNGIKPENTEVSLSLHPFAKSQFLPLLIIKTNKLLNESEITEIINNHFKTLTSKYEYQNYKIFHFNYNSIVYYYIICEDIVCISTSKLIIENIIKQENKGYSLFKNKAFATLFKTTGKNSDLNIFINFKYFSQLWHKWFKQSNLLNKISYIKPANFAFLDCNITNEKLFIYGYCDISDSLNFYLKVLDIPTNNTNISILSVIPNDIHSFLYLSLADINEFKRRRMLFLEANGIINDYNSKIELYKKTLKMNFLDSLYKILENECCILYKLTNTDKITSFLVFKISNKSYSIENIELWLKKITESTNRKQYKESISLDEEYSFEVYKSPINEIGTLLIGELFGTIKTNFFTFYDDYLIFAETKEDLKYFVYSNILNKTFKYDNFFKKHNDLIDNSSMVVFFSNIKKSCQWYSEIFNSNISEVIVQNFEIFKNIDALIFQISNINNYLYSSLITTYGTTNEDNIINNWESKLDTISIMKPTFVVNHYTGETEIFIQDLYNNIYLINKMGRILWKENISEKIISDIYQIDILNNKKLQYIFNTRNYIHVIDRTGKEVYPFPIRLKSPATNGLLVTHDNNTKDKRIYIACEDKKVYCYTLTGKLSKEWKTFQANYCIYQPVQCFYFKNNKYIVFNDSLNVYILNKNGKPLIKLNERFSMNKNSRVYFDNSSGNNPFFIVNDISGTIRYIYLDGTVNKLILKKDITTSHYYLYNDIDGDGYPDHIIVDENKVFIFNNKGKEISSFKIEGLPQFRPNFYSFPANKNKIGVVINNKLYLYDFKGNIPQGLPLKSSSPFSIAHSLERFKKYSLITCTPDGFLINYEIKN